MLICVVASWPPPWSETAYSIHFVGAKETAALRR